MRIALCGALGKMGREVFDYCQDTKDIDVVLFVDKLFDGTILQAKTPQKQRLSDAKNYVNFYDKNFAFDCSKNGIETVCNIDDAQCDFDAIIDFSSHNATISILKTAIVRRCSVVLATTGHTEVEKKYIEYASQFIPLFYANNMSLGIAVLAKCIKETLSVFNRSNTISDGVCRTDNNELKRLDAQNFEKSEQLDAENRDNFKGIDVEIIETHHTQKADVPSGTALMLAAAVKNSIGGQIVVGRHENGKKKEGDIGVHSLRMGSVFGQHEVRINTSEEVMTFTHEALSRKVYAKGAIEAVRYLKSQSAGLYGIDDLL